MTKAPFSRRVSLGFGVLVALGAAGALSVYAQAPAGGGRQKLTFIAVDANGAPVTNLEASQVDLKIDGKARPVQSLSLINVGAAAAGAAAPKGLFDTPIPAAYASNVVAPSRAVIFAIDEESMSPGSDKPLKDAVAAFIDGLAAGDRVGLFTMPRGTIGVDLTSDHAVIKEKLAGVNGRMPGSRTDTEDACHAHDVLEALGGIFGRSAGQGQVSVVVFSSGLASPTSTTKAASGTAGACELTTNEFQQTGTAAAASHALTYIVQPETARLAGDMQGLQALAGAVGSPLMNLSGGGLDRVMKESSAYYVAEIGYEPSEADGRSHRVDLKVATAGATLRAPSEITFPKADAKGSKVQAKDIVKETKIYSDLPLRVAAFTMRGSGEKMLVSIIMGSNDPGATLASASVGVADGSGSIRTLSIPSGDLAKPLIVTAMEVTPGTYRVHGAAVDATGRAGSADYHLEASLTPAGPMKLSSLIVGANGSAGFAPQFEFKDEPEAIVDFFIYGLPTDIMMANGSFDLAATPDGPTLVQGEQLKVDRGGAADAFQAQGVLKIDKLEPGDYVVRLTMGVEGQAPGKVYRTLRKVK